jgi:hypothetical protein
VKTIPRATAAATVETMAQVSSNIPIVSRSFWLRFGVWQLHADRRQGYVTGEASDWEPIKKEMVDTIGCARYGGMADFDIPAPMPAFSSQRVSIMSRRLFIGHEIHYHF